MAAPATVTRFAPSPTGHLHLGHAYSALFAAAAAGPGGRMLLRIEDIDIVRCRPEFAAAIVEDLGWLGITWSGPVRRQSEHFDDYARALARLDARGLLYPCFCTRRQIQAEIAASPAAPHGPDGPVYPGTCRRLTAAERDRRLAGGQPYALRLDMAAALRQAAAAGPLLLDLDDAGLVPAAPQAFGDVVLARKEMPASYHLAVTVDDALQGVTLVTRGSDLAPAAHLHRLLQALLDLPVPVWRHHPLLLDDAGQRLAKRHGAAALRDLRREGVSAVEVRRRLGFL